MKKEYILLIAVMIALVAYLIVDKTDRLSYELPQVPDIAAKEITKIEIARQGQRITLHKSNSDWQIQGSSYIADKKKMDKMIKSIASFDLTAMVSESKNYLQYDLSEKEKLYVQVWKNKDKLLAFGIGKTAGTNRHTFVKLPDDHRVYHARGNFRNNFDVNPQTLRDKQVMSFDQNEIKKIQLYKKDQLMTLFRETIPVSINGDEKKDMQNKEGMDKTAQHKESQWKTENGDIADEEKLTGLLDLLSDLRCREFLYEQTTDDFKDPLYTIELFENQSESRKYTLSVFENAEDENRYSATSSLSNDPFVLPKWQAQKIMIDFEEF